MLQFEGRITGLSELTKPPKSGPYPHDIAFTVSVRNQELSQDDAISIRRAFRDGKRIRVYVEE